MGLKEPTILNDLVGWKRRGCDLQKLAATLDISLALLARPFEDGEVNIIKPSNIVNSLAPALLGLRPQSRAILLYAPLSTFLTSIVKKGLWGRLWVRELFAGLRSDKMIQLGFTDEQHFLQSDLQIAAAGWLAQQDYFSKLCERFGAARIRTLDSKSLLADPLNMMEKLAQFYGLPLEPATLKAVAEGPAFTTHSKTKEFFGAEDRRQEYDMAVEAHRDEIEKVTVWAETVAQERGIPLTLPLPLLLS